MNMTKTEFVLKWLEEHGIEYQVHYHPPLPTIEEALAYWKNIDSVHCKNLFFRNHKGNRHYMASFECHKNLDIHGLAQSSAISRKHSTLTSSAHSPLPRP